MKKKLLKIFSTFILLFSLSACSFLEIEEVTEEETQQADKPGNPEYSDINSKPESWNNLCLADINLCPVHNDSSTEAYNTVQEAYENTVSSIVTILVYKKNTNAMISLGSGIIYATSNSKDYVYIITNAHVITSPAYSLSFEVLYYNGVKVKAEYVVANTVEDIGIIKAKVEPNNDYSVAKLGNSDNAKVGEAIYTIGTPKSLDHTNTLTSGIISGTNVLLDTDNDGDEVKINMYLFQIDAALSSGNSGGPLFNMKGEVIGINTLKFESSSGNLLLESFNFSIRMNKAIKVANELLINGYYKRPEIGISVIDLLDLSLKERENYAISTNVTHGIYINSISPNSAAEGILYSSTIITHINGIKIHNLSDFSVELLNHVAGDSIKLTTTDVGGTHITEKTITLK